MNLLVLGPPVVQAHPPVHLTSRKALALLVILALEGPRSREELARLLWRGSRPLALQSLRSSLTTLRVALGEHASLLYIERDRVFLDDTRLHLDARQLDTAGEHELLTLWRGPFLQGLRIHDSPEWDDWVNEWSARLHARFEARVQHVMRQLLHGEHFDKALSLARQVLAADPFSEQRVTLMLDALVQAGRVSEARQEANAFAERFSREFGEPPALPSLPELPAPPPTAPPRTNLHFERTPFIGRTVEQAHARNALRQFRLVTLHGQGGLGKTRLARTIGRTLADESVFEYVAFVPMETARDISELPERVAATLGHIISNVKRPLDELAELIGHRRLLLILDNFEQLSAQALALNELLGRCPHLRILVTSRERLHLKAEAVLPLTPLVVPSVNADVSSMREADALRLFMERAQSARIDFTPTEDIWPLVRRACELVGGLPLGIELAAAWTSTWPLAFIVQELERDPLALQHPLRDASPRQHSLRSSFDLSWRLLRDEDRRVLERLSVFHGGFTLEAAREVAGATPNSLAELTSKALVRLESVTRYTFHPLLREYARAHLDERPEEREAALDAHAKYFLSALRSPRMTVGGAASPELLAFVRDEDANLLALLPYLQATRQYEHLTALVEPLLWHYPATAGPSGFGFALHLSEELLNALPHDDTHALTARLTVTSSYAWLLLFVGSLGASIRLYEDAVRLARTLQDDVAVQRALDGLGQALYRSARSEEATVALEDAVRLAERQGDPYRLFRSLNNLMMAAGMSDDFERAGSAEQHARSFRTRGDVADGMDVVWFLTNEGVIHLLQGQHDRALTLWQEGLDVAARTGMLGQRTVLHALRAWAFLDQGVRFEQPYALQDADRAVQEALGVARQTGEPFALNLALVVSARLKLHEGDASSAVRDMREALLGCWRSENLTLLVWLLPYLAEAFEAHGDVIVAAELAVLLTRSPLVKQHVRRHAEAVLERTQRHVDTSNALPKEHALTLDDIVARFLFAE
ncbi:ATP-binding protein [Deinococcus yavapaiensis]|uniref:ATP-binding protein n=1 Tax=Deinococcus yavapaiensis TaxID=309889 RepID=UPI001474D42C|nr:NACHT domain-containing protein [Deinococcus yavapaiensis]